MRLFGAYPDVNTAVIMGVYVIMAIGLNIVVGYAGLLDLGYVAFYAMGAYTCAWFASVQFAQPDITFGAAGVGATRRASTSRSGLLLVLAGIVTALHRHPHRPADVAPTRRLPRDRDARLRRDPAAGREQRRQPGRLQPDERPERHHADRLARLRAPELPQRLRHLLHRAAPLLLVRAVLVAITVFCSLRLRDSRLGRAWIAIREDETAAAAMGVPLMRTKTWAYATGAFFGGVAGAYFATFKSSTFPNDFRFNISAFILSMVILGGMGNVWGVMFGAAFLAYLNQEGLANIGHVAQRRPSAPTSTCRCTSSGSTARSSCS